MNFTAKDVATLREKTGCGMMDCKKALTESNGDMEAAIDVLREKGLAKAAKKAGRIAAEGVAFAYVNDTATVGVVIEVNAETDFVAKNAEFQEFVKVCARYRYGQNPADVEALLACTAAGSDQTVDALLKDKILVDIGENIKVRRFARMEGKVAAYIHAGGNIGVLVNFETEADPTAAAFQGNGQERGHAGSGHERAVPQPRCGAGRRAGPRKRNPHAADRQRRQTRSHCAEDCQRPSGQIL